VGHVAATRSPQEVFNHHVQALGAEDLDEIVADFSDDAMLITPAGVLRGKDSIRQAFAGVLGEIPQATWDLKTTISRTTSCSWSGAPKAAATASRTASTPSSSATASSGSRPSAIPSNLPADERASQDLNLGPHPYQAHSRDAFMLEERDTASSAVGWQ
jgi:hypothetical protein